MGELPGLVPAEVRFIQQDAHQLRHGHRRVGVVELDGDFLGKRAPVIVAAAEAPDEIGQRTGNEKVLLYEAQALSHARGVVGIEYACQVFGLKGFGPRGDEFAVAERLEVEGIWRRRRPEPQRVDRLAAVADHGTIEGDPDQTGRLAGDGTQGAASDLERAVQFDLNLFIGARDLPGVRAAEPVVRLFVLPAVLDGLPEHAVLVAQPIAHGGELHGGHRVEKARRQAAEPPIAQARVGFLFEEVEPIEVLVLDSLPGERIEQEVHHIVGQRAADEKLHREIVDALGVLALVSVLRKHPALCEDVPHGAGQGLELFAWAGRCRFDDVVENEVALVKRVVRPREL